MKARTRGMIRASLLLAVLAAGLQPALARDLRAVEQQMQERPAEAFTLARRAAEGLPAAQVRDLFVRAAQLQEDRLALLTEDQVQELASIYLQPLEQPRAAERVRRGWLTLRRQALGPADGPGRLRLAGLTFRWFHERDAAAQLCQEALRVAPELTTAAQMLRDDLGYQQTDEGWRPRDGMELGDRARNAMRLRSGMTPAEVRALLGPPQRVARQILYRRYLEQWIYDAPPLLWVEFDCPKGREPRLQTVHHAGETK